MKEQHMKTAIEMAGQIDAVTKVLLDRKEPQGMSHETFVWFLERFDELSRADEREACARRAGVALLGADRGLANRVDHAIRTWGAAQPADTV